MRILANNIFYLLCSKWEGAELELMSRFSYINYPCRGRIRETLAILPNLYTYRCRLELSLNNQ